MKNRKAFLTYVGAKNRALPRIGEALHATGRKCLVDVFGGSAAVTIHSGFLKRVYNDADGDLVNLFQVMACGEKRAAMLRKLRWLPPSRRIYMEDYAVYKAGGLSFQLINDPVDRARATFYRLCFCFGGKMRSGGFQQSIIGRDEIKEVQRYRNRLKRFAEVGDFFRGTVIENLDWQDVIRIYGRGKENVLFVDPPYVDKDDNYSVRFCRCDHVFLAESLAGITAPVVATFYDHPLVRELYPERVWTYSSFTSTKNSANSRGQKVRVEELLLTKRAR